jgi:hypothetical protein
VNWYFGLLIVGAGLVAKIAGANSLALSIEIAVGENPVGMFVITFILFVLVNIRLLFESKKFIFRVSYSPQSRGL